MKIFKFGGASVNSVERIQALPDLLAAYQSTSLLVVVSAMGKTTNALEAVTAAFVAGNQNEALSLFGAVRESHQATLEALIPDAGLTNGMLTDITTEVEWLLHDQPVRSYDYYYDQIVCAGELLATRIVSAYLGTAGVPNEWIDVRDVIRTDARFREASIDWKVTAEKTATLIQPLLVPGRPVITQGFIGATEDNESTTLGREGSDYTGAVFANLLSAESETIWKDVPGVMNADPKKYAAAEWIAELNYREVVEMAYYGAQVIHPKTIKPLQNKGIPLIVRSFLDPEQPGTVIHTREIATLPPVIVFKEDQVLIQLSTVDFSFAGEGLTVFASELFADLNIKPNLTQNAAISLLCVADRQPDKLAAFVSRIPSAYTVSLQEHLTLLTLRHSDSPALLSELIKGRMQLLKQESPGTIQILLQN